MKKKKELIRRTQELDWARRRIEKLDAEVNRAAGLDPYVLPESKTVYVSGKEQYVVAEAVLRKLERIFPSPTALTLTVTYIPAGIDGEPAYYSGTATADV